MKNVCKRYVAVALQKSKWNQARSGNVVISKKSERKLNMVLSKDEQKHNKHKRGIVKLYQVIEPAD